MRCVITTMEQGRDVTIVKPFNDKRDYKRVVLPNALQVLLISDPDTDKAAASMNVSVGAFSDPEGLEGLAHFLEHMLFYASEKYPLEDSYMQYLTEHGGRSNAFTGYEHTNFHFDVNADYFEGALDRFAQFFICPLMSPDATSREIKAVDSENKKNTLVDTWRLWQLQKHISSNDHPFHKFSTGWASSLSAGEAYSSFEYACFGVRIELTDAGQEHMEEIVDHTFQYLQILRKSGIAEWIFDELRGICNTMFHFRDKIPPINYVTSIASKIELYQPQDWLVASSLPSKFNAITIQMVLEQLVPSKSRIFWASKQFEGQTNEIEPWYGTAFSVEKIKDDLVKQWAVSQPDARLGLPLPNRFIPTDLMLKQLVEKVEHPVLLRKSEFSRLWYKPDTMFFTPKAYIKLDFNCPESNCSPEAEVLTQIFTMLLMDYLNEYAYYAKVAGLAYDIYHTGTGFQVTIVGYNHKMRILLKKILQKIVHFEVKEDRFAVIKENVLKDYLNYKFQQPYQQALYYTSLLLKHRMWQRNEFLEVLPHIEADNLMKFVPRITLRTFIECYVSGNMTSKEAELLVQDIEESLLKGPAAPSKPLFPSQHVEERIVRLDSRTNHYYPIEGLSEKDENSALLHYIQLEQDDSKMNVQLELFILSAKQTAFHQLRSVEQLGYIVRLTTRNDSGVRGAQFTIQSTVKDPGQLDLRVEAFLKMFESKLYAMSDDEFKANVDVLIDVKLEKHKNLQEESHFYWREIEVGTLKFDRQKIEVDVLRKLTKQDLINFFDNYIKHGCPGRRKLTVQVYGSSHSGAYKLARSIDISSNKDVYNGKTVTSDTLGRELLKDDTVKLASSDQSAYVNSSELDGYQGQRIRDIDSFKRSQKLFGSLRSGVNQSYN